jgi:hypothetical protein
MIIALKHGKINKREEFLTIFHILASKVFTKWFLFGTIVKKGGMQYVKRYSQASFAGAFENSLRNGAQ